MPLLLKLGQGGPALRKAIQSGDTDLAHHVILALQQQHSQAEFHLIIRQDSAASKLYSLYCRKHPAGLLGGRLDISCCFCARLLCPDWLQQEDDYASLARLSYAESYATGRLETRLASLVTAQDQFRRARLEQHAAVADENHRLLKYQNQLEEKLGKPFLNLSLYQVRIAGRLATLTRCSARPCRGSWKRRK